MQSRFKRASISMKTTFRLWAASAGSDSKPRSVPEVWYAAGSKTSQTTTKIKKDTGNITFQGNVTVHSPHLENTLSLSLLQVGRYEILESDIESSLVPLIENVEKSAPSNKKLLLGGGHRYLGWRPLLLVTRSY